MENILRSLCDHFYRMPENTPQAKRVEANHRTLIEHLRKADRKLVLWIIDDKDQICSDVSLDSFICGFRLAWRITTQLNSVKDGHLAADCEVRPDARSIFMQEEAR